MLEHKPALLSARYLFGSADIMTVCPSGRELSPSVQSLQNGDALIFCTFLKQLGMSRLGLLWTSTMEAFHGFVIYFFNL